MSAPKAKPIKRLPASGPAVQVGEAVNALAPLSKLNAADMPPLLSYAVMELLESLRQSPQVIACNSVRETAFKKHGIDKGGGTYEIPVNDMARVTAFSSDYVPIAEKPLDLKFKPLPLADILENAPKMSGNELRALRPFLA